MQLFITFQTGDDLHVAKVLEKRVIPMVRSFQFVQPLDGGPQKLEVQLYDDRESGVASFPLVIDLTNRKIWEISCSEFRSEKKRERRVGQ